MLCVILTVKQLANLTKSEVGLLEIMLIKIGMMFHWIQGDLGSEYFHWELSV